MKTICVQIGNSDDKLTQKEWSAFTLSVDAKITGRRCKIHFSGSSGGRSPWQNYCIVFACDNLLVVSEIKEDMLGLKERFNQDLIAWLEGETEFI